MKLLTLAFTLAATAASAQSLLLLPPQFTQVETVPIINDAMQTIGSATTYENKVYLRDLRGAHFATIVYNPDGTRTNYDPSGNVIDRVPTPNQTVMK